MLWNECYMNSFISKDPQLFEEFDSILIKGHLRISAESLIMNYLNNFIPGIRSLENKI